MDVYGSIWYGVGIAGLVTLGVMLGVLVGWHFGVQARPEPVTERKPFEGGPVSDWVEQWYKPGDEMLNGVVLRPGYAGVRLLGDIELWDTGECMALLGDALSARFHSPRSDAVAEFANPPGRDEPGCSVGFGSLSCWEAKTLAKLLAVHGHFRRAVYVIAEHVLEDGRGDEHGYIRVADVENGTGRDDEAAEVYVRRLLGETAQPEDEAAKRAELADVQAVIVKCVETDKILARSGTTVSAETEHEAQQALENLLARELQLRQELGEHLDDIEISQANY